MYACTNFASAIRQLLNREHLLVHFVFKFDCPLTCEIVFWHNFHVSHRAIVENNILLRLQTQWATSSSTSLSKATFNKRALLFNVPFDGDVLVLVAHCVCNLTMIIYLSILFLNLIVCSHTYCMLAQMPF